MTTKSDNIHIVMGSETDEIIKELFESLLQRYQEGLEEKMRGSEFVFGSVDLLYYHLQKISPKSGGSDLDSPKWLKDEIATVDPKNNDDNCFQYALIVALNYQNIKNNPERISKTKSFINQFDWKEIEFPSDPKDWKKFELNNKTIALNILFVPYDTKEVRLAYKSKYNFKQKNQVILLMITDGKKWHYLTVKSLSALFKGITSNHNGDFYCLNCFHSYSTEKKIIKKHEKVCNDHDYCYVEMSNEDNKILRHNHRYNHLLFMLTWSVCLKICTHLKIILKNPIQKKNYA